MSINLNKINPDIINKINPDIINKINPEIIKLLTDAVSVAHETFLNSIKHIPLPIVITKVPPQELKIRSFAAPPSGLPVTVDLRPGFPAVYNQGQIGSCTAQAISAIYQYQYPNLSIPSRLFIYYNERSLAGLVSKTAWKSTTLSGPWTSLQGASDVSQIKQIKDGSFIGINQRNNIIYSSSISGPWNIVISTPVSDFFSISQLSNNSFIAINNFNIVTSNTLAGPWIVSNNPRDNRSVALIGWTDCS
jgi:hypothetical protein